MKAAKLDLNRMAQPVSNSQACGHRPKCKHDYGDFGYGGSFCLTHRRFRRLLDPGLWNLRAKIVLHCDGACRGNPGQASIGFVAHRDQDRKELFEGSALMGEATNNEAEYQAVISGLTAAVTLGFKDVLVISDSALVVHQVNGVYKASNPRMAKLRKQVMEQAKKLHLFGIGHVRREYNRRADALAGAAFGRM